MRTALFLLVFATFAVRAQDAPGLMRIVVPFPPGGSNDVIARAIAPVLAKRLGNTVIVENKPGAAGVVGADAVATVGLTESMMVLIYTAAIGLSIGATALVARRIGEHDPERAADAAGQALLLGLAVSAGISLICAPLAPDLLRLMGASEDVVRTGSGFTRVMLAGNASVLLLFMLLMNGLAIYLRNRFERRW